MNKAQTILTSRNLNKKLKAAKVNTVSNQEAFELTKPSAKNPNKSYVFVSGVILPIVD